MTKVKSFFFIFFVLLINSSVANEPLISKKKAPLSVALPLLKSIDHYAIVIGNGPTHMYAFIDPVCPRSREFVEMIIENEKMQKRYTYHFFYYELKRFHSKGLIGTIYTNNDPFSTMLEVMLRKHEVEPIKTLPPKVITQMNNISKVAEQLDIDKRPYLFVVKLKKGDE